MKKLTVPVLDDKDKEFVESLVKVGLNRNISKTLVYLANVEETLSRDIEIGANLRQPEVSLVMRELRAQGWVGEREIKKEGKGRPVKAIQAFCQPRGHHLHIRREQAKRGTGAFPEHRKATATLGQDQVTL